MEMKYKEIQANGKLKTKTITGTFKTINDGYHFCLNNLQKRGDGTINLQSNDGTV